VASRIAATDGTAATIADERLRRLVETIVNALHPEEIWLFGSRAHGEAREDSDYDSDYDLFVVVSDETHGKKFLLQARTNSRMGLACPPTSSAAGDARSKRIRMKSARLCYTVMREGILMYDESGRPLARGRRSG
jgi:predicted nucleotidyltransferase